MMSCVDSIWARSPSNTTTGTAGTNRVVTDSDSIPRAQRIAARIDAGTVMINEVLYTHGIAQAPWGGVKQSGLGRTHGRAGLLELVNAQHIHVNRVPFIPDLWWFNYDEGHFDVLAGHHARRLALWLDRCASNSQAPTTMS